VTRWTIRSRPGFNPMNIAWGRQDKPIADYCSYCGARRLRTKTAEIFTTDRAVLPKLRWSTSKNANG
jgi:hypothetical protein